MKNIITNFTNFTNFTRITFLVFLCLLATSSIQAQCLVCSNGTDKACIQGVASADATDSTCIANFGAGFSKLEYSTNNCNLVDGCDDPLPVELIDFKALRADKKEVGVVLEWQTATETNNHGFEIERSSFGDHWEYIGFVDGNGTTTEINTYSWTDDSPTQGINYYRLKQIDTDGVFTYSDVVSVEITSDNASVKLFPNPVGEILFLNSGLGKAMLYNSLGQQIGCYDLQAGTSQINVASLASGIYILEVKLESNSLVTLRFVK